LTGSAHGASVTVPLLTDGRDERGTAMRVWIDQDCCTGAGLCVDHCPELFVVLEDGIGYVHLGSDVVTDPDRPSVSVPIRYEHAAIDAVERCPGECIYLEPDHAPPPSRRGDERELVALDDASVLDADIVEPEAASD
jgi:ferredoxin